MTSISLSNLNDKVLFNSKIIIPVIIASFSSLLIQNIWIAILIVLFAYLLILYGINFFFFFVIVSLLTLVGEFNHLLRLVIQLIAFGGLSFLFIKEYGLEFVRYPKVPAILLNFITLIFSVMALSTVFSNYLYTGAVQIVKLVIFFYLMYLLHSFIKSDEIAKIYIKSLFIASAIMALSTFIHLYSGGINLANLAISHFRTGGLLGNVNAIGGYYAVVIPVAVTFLFYKGKEINKLYLVILIMIFSFGLLAVTSRSAIISILVSLLFILFYLNKRLLLLFIGLMLLLLLMYFFFDPIYEFISVVLRVERGLSRRDYLWQLSSDMIKDNFWFGVGPGAWGKEMFNYFPVLLNSYKGKLFIKLFELTGGFNGSHNFYLFYFTEMGIFGLITSIIFPIVFFRIGFKTIKNTKHFNKIYNLLAIGITSVGAGMFVRAFFEGISLITIHRITVDIPFWLLFIILIYLYNKVLHIKPEFMTADNIRV